MATKSGQPIAFQVANLMPFKMLLPAVKMRFGQNGGQPIAFQNGQNVDNPVPLRHIYIYIFFSFAWELFRCPPSRRFKVN